MEGIETLLISLLTSASLVINASVWYKLGSIESRVKNCENFKVSPKC
ncbi:MAG: hypothetical protein R2741_08475 [Methanolobus sp.]